MKKGIFEMKEVTFVIVDDSSFIRTILKKMLEETEGFNVLGEASDGEEAVRIAGEIKPDILTLDITMPNMDGLSAVKKILEVSPNTKIIMISAMGQQSVVIDAIKCGAKDFVIKPFEKSRVMQAIKNVLAI
jgi:two-component system chemotaxis response regulator CheY